MKIELWIGAFEREREGNWIWSDCQPWKWSNWDSTYWREQPNKYGGNENCALLSGARIARGKESFLSSGTMCLVRKVQNLSVQRGFLTKPARPHYLQRTLVLASQVHSLCATNLLCRTPYCNNYSGNRCCFRFDHIRQPRFPGVEVQEEEEKDRQERTKLQRDESAVWTLLFSWWRKDGR